MSDTLKTDIVQDLINEVDSTALDVTILQYINNPDNGFMDSTTYTIYSDTTSYVTLDGTNFEWIVTYHEEISRVDTTALITVEEWKALYLEETFNESLRAKYGVAVRDGTSPNYPLKDFELLLDEDDTTYLSYDATAPVEFTIDSTSFELTDIVIPQWHMIEYEYPNITLFGGVTTSIESFISDSTADEIYQMGFFFVGTSENGTTWTYQTFSGEVSDIESAKSNPFSESPVAFVKPKKAKYLRLYFNSGALQVKDIPPDGFEFLDSTSTITHIYSLTYDEIQEGRRIRNTSTPPAKLTSTTISASTTGELGGSGNTDSTIWLTIGQASSTNSLKSQSNEECRVERGTGTRDLHVRILNEDDDVVDSIVLTDVGFGQLFARNVSLEAGQSITRKIQLMVGTGTGGVNYAIKYQNTRHGFG